MAVSDDPLPHGTISVCTKYHSFMMRSLPNMAAWIWEKLYANPVLLIVKLECTFLNSIDLIKVSLALYIEPRREMTPLYHSERENMFLSSQRLKGIVANALPSNSQMEF